MSYEDKISVRPANIEDIKDIFIWRNDQHTRNMFHNTELIRWDEHEKWFTRTLANSEKLLTICQNREAVKIAIVRFDVSLNKEDESHD